jgi:hypothetical protein
MMQQASNAVKESIEVVQARFDEYLKGPPVPHSI